MDNPYLARIEDPYTQMLYSRSSRDLIELAAAHPEAWRRALGERPLLVEAHAFMVRRAEGVLPFAPAGGSS